MEREPDIDAAIETPAALAPAVDRLELTAIFAGGSLGALARAALAELLHVPVGSWPWASFSVNMAASFVLAFAVTWIGEHHPRTMYARAFWATGVSGALSTFSTVMLELVRLQESAGAGLACAYGLASIAGGLALVLLGVALAERLAPTRGPAPLPEGGEA
jgi:fluoride exporter